MQWFIELVVNMFTSIYNTLDSITFMGTSLLKFSLTIMILASLVTVLFTIANSYVVNGERFGRAEGRREKNKKRSSE